MLKNRWIPEPDLEQILAHADRRDRDIFTLLLETGYRVDDLVSSRASAWEGGSVTLLEKKTGKQRTVKLSEKAKKAAINLRGEKYLLTGSRRTSRGETHMHRATVWRHWNKTVKEAGRGGKGYTVHSLRKCYAIRRLRETGNVEAVQKDLNHDRWVTTLLYLSDAMMDAFRRS